MFDTMTLTKIVGALCGSFLVFLLGGWAAETIYFGGGGHDDHEAAYVIDTGSAEAAEAPAEEGPPFAELLAAADVAKGEKAFSQCKACHKIDGTNGTGPHLKAIMGREVGKVEGFAFSAGMVEHGGAWTPELMNTWITNPKAMIAGTKMSYAGMKKPVDRANLIAYLATLN